MSIDDFIVSKICSQKSTRTDISIISRFLATTRLNRRSIVSYISMETRIDKVSSQHISLLKGIKVAEPTASTIRAAANLLHQSQVVAFPTETVYGLGANALDDIAVKAIFTAKNRPADNPLILHVSSFEMLKAIADVPDVYLPLLKAFWPGPLTVLLRLTHDSKISKLCTHGQSTFAVRMPKHPIALALIDDAGVPLAAPSANASTRPSPTTAQHVLHDLKGRIFLILDGGPCDVGVESTVVDGLVEPPELLRPGGITLEQIRAIPGWEGTIIHKPNVDSSAPPRTPGMKYRHYSPSARIMLFEHSMPTMEVLRQHDALHKRTAICRTFKWSSDLATELNATDCCLGSTGEEVSQRLFSTLRDLDDQGIELILVEAISEDHEGLAVMNRLRKASSIIL